MMTVLVNGLPGAGKTTLARSLALELALPLFSKDAVKETIADAPGMSAGLQVTQREWSRAVGGAAADVLWTLLGTASGGAILEGAWLANVREFTLAGLARAGATDIQEVWCDVPVELARHRFVARIPDRHPIHFDDQPDSLARWDEWSRSAEPMNLGPVHRVDTSQPVDIAALAGRIRASSCALGFRGACEDPSGHRHRP